MKGLKLGYDQLDNGEKIYAKFPLNFYGKFISKITTQDIPEEKSILLGNLPLSTIPNPQLMITISIKYIQFIR